MYTEISETFFYAVLGLVILADLMLLILVVFALSERSEAARLRLREQIRRELMEEQTKEKSA